MMTIQLENPSIERYIKEIGKENIEKMFLSFLEIKSKLNQLPTQQREEDQESFKKAQEFGINPELHRKILALKPKRGNEADEMTQLIDTISNRIGDKYKNKSYDDLRDEYFKDKGYL